MGLDLSKYVNISDPIAKLVKETGNQLIDTAENAVIGELTAALQRTGLGNGSNKNLLGNLGEQILAGIAGEIFRAIGYELNLSSKSDIELYRGVLVEGDARRDQIEADNISKINGGATPTNLIYPSDLNEFYIQLDFKKYVRPAPNVLADVKTEFSVSLPLPRVLEDRHAVSYNNRLELGLVGAIFNQGQNNGGKDVVNGVGDAALTAAAYTGAEGIRMLTGGGGQALVALISQNFGATLNPHLSVMFQAPTLRSHRMSWLLSPNNPAESEMIRKIAQTIKAASLPAFIRNSQGNANINLLEMPMMCKMTLYPWGDKTKFDNYKKDPSAVYNGNMYTFKHCVIDSISVNYSPSGLAFFENEGNAPAFLLLEMSFLEIEYFTAEDFGRYGGTIDAAKSIKKLGEDIAGADGVKLAEDILGIFDTNAGADTAQASDTNNFALSASTVMEEYASTTNDDFAQSFLYKTSDGSWYEATMTPYGNDVKPISDFNNERFDIYDVPSENRNTTPIVSGDPVMHGDTPITLTTDQNTGQINIT